MWRFVSLSYLSQYKQGDSGQSLSTSYLPSNVNPPGGGKRLSSLRINPKWLSREDFPEPGEVRALDYKMCNSTAIWPECRNLRAVWMPARCHVLEGAIAFQNASGLCPLPCICAISSAPPTPRPSLLSKVDKVIFSLSTAVF